MGKRSIRYCADKACSAEAIYGAFCITHIMERDPDHMGVIDWGDPCELDSLANALVLPAPHGVGRNTAHCGDPTACNATPA